MGNRRDRHMRGMRGPLASPSAYGPAMRRPGIANRAEAFVDAVSEAIARVNVSCPEALVGIDIGIEDVPSAHTSGGRVPLAAATEASTVFPARIVIYRRPLEHRAATRRGLRILVHRTLVEQLAALTGRSVNDIDPESQDEDSED